MYETRGQCVEVPGATPVTQKLRQHIALGSWGCRAAAVPGPHLCSTEVTGPAWRDAEPELISPSKRPGEQVLLPKV